MTASHFRLKVNNGPRCTFSENPAVVADEDGPPVKSISVAALIMAEGMGIYAVLTR